MGKKIVLGVTGSIAAHKAVDIASLLTKEGHSVHAVLTADAQQFITALPFKTLSRNPVVTNLYDEEQGWKPTHIVLADEADLLVIAPATANILAKMAHGIADDALSCIALALNTAARTVVAPARSDRLQAAQCPGFFQQKSFQLLVRTRVLSVHPRSSECRHPAAPIQSGGAHLRRIRPL